METTVQNAPPTGAPDAEFAADEHPFIAHLRRLHEAQDRGALAALRRGVGRPPGSVYAMYPFVVPFLPREGGRRREDAYFIVGALFALHPEPGGRGNLGVTFRRAVAGKDDLVAVERRFTALLAADPEEFDDHLRHAVTFLRARAQPIDWSQLLRDLLAWTHPDAYVQRQWARAFWGRAPASGEGEGAMGEG